MLFSKANTIEISQETFCCNFLLVRPVFFFITALDYSNNALVLLNLFAFLEISLYRTRNTANKIILVDSLEVKNFVSFGNFVANKVGIYAS